MDPVSILVSNWNFVFVIVSLFVMFFVAKNPAKALIHAVYVMAGSIIVPVLGIYFLGWNYILSSQSIIGFVMVGLICYYIYLVFRTIYHYTSRLESSMKRGIKPLDAFKKKKA
ncbi:MAG: hypothetical protein J4473_02845 [Candidatus Aenigmarchaeota archaeon]|nr:hypothetical protein [Candidatus Aenigmarchaeota archaeon]